MADYNSLVNLYRKATQAEEEEEKRKSNQIYDNQAQVINDTYNSAIETSDADYRRLEREAEIQRLINKNEVAENMASLGHKDSGLSRDQTAAVEIAASNQKAKISLARQQAKEAKILEMKSKLAEIENNRLSADNSISNAYTKLATDNAAAYIKNEQGNSGDGLYHYMRTETNSNGNEYVVYSYNGKEVKFDKGVNPYTGANNSTYEVLNGYQTKNVYKNGENLGEIKESEYLPTEIDGQKVKIYKTEPYMDPNESTLELVKRKKQGNRYWYWSDSKNEYIEIFINADGKWEEV